MSLSYAPFNKDFKRKFLALPQILYSADNITQNIGDEKALLENRHILSKYFTFHPILVLSGKAPAARGAVTVYHGDNTAYFGFFESVKSTKAAQMVFDKAEEIAKSQGCTKICGPVDGSFWIKYRLKINRFEQPPYAGEPYNLPYYEKFFVNAGYRISYEYKSMRFEKMSAETDESKYTDRLADKRLEGYEIVSPLAESFDRCLREIYRLLIDLYADFPVYKRITEEEFVGIYSKLRYVIDYKMVKLAYKNGEPVGFYVSVPNTGNLTSGRFTPKKLVDLLKLRKNCGDYVMLYMGVSPEHHGLGKALVQSIKNELSENGAKSVGALIRSGKITGTYYAEYADFEYRYALFEKDI